MPEREATRKGWEVECRKEARWLAVLPEEPVRRIVIVRMREESRVRVGSID